MTKQLIPITLLTAILTIGCQNAIENGGSAAGVINVDENDADMVDAIEKAKGTFDFFVENWQTMASDSTSVKFALPTADQDLEHIWFSPVKIQGDQVTGTCANDPANIPGLKYGDTRTVSRSEVSDWMILTGNKCYGGYTIRVLSRRNPSVAPPLEFVDPPKN